MNCNQLYVKLNNFIAEGGPRGDAAEEVANLFLRYSNEIPDDIHPFLGIHDGLVFLSTGEWPGGAPSADDPESGADGPGLVGTDSVPFSGESGDGEVFVGAPSS